MTAPRPTIDQHAAGLRLYRANASPDRIAELTGMSPEQVDRAITDGWAAGSRHEPDLPSFDAQIEDRSIRIRIARLDWAQVVAEAAAPGAQLRAETASTAAKIERLVLQAWAHACDLAMERAKATGLKPTPAELSVPLETVRSLRALRLAQDPGAEQKIAELFRSIRGEQPDDGTEDEWEIVADLAGCSKEEQERYVATGERPSRPQQVLPFDRKSG